MSAYPIALDGSRLRALVAGAGPVAARKVRALLECGAAVTVIAPAVSPEMDSIRSPRLDVRREHYAPNHLAGHNLVFAATSSDEVNAAIARDASAAGVFCNVASDWESGSFAALSAYRDGPLAVAVFASGAPTAAARIREHIGASLPPDLGRALEILLGVRSRLLAEHDTDGWKRASEELSGPDFLESVRSGEFERRVAKWL